MLSSKKYGTKLARLYTSNVFNNNLTSYSQWFPGEQNDMLTNSLFTDFNSNPNSLSSLYFSQSAARNTGILSYNDSPQTHPSTHTSQAKFLFNYQAPTH